MSQSLWFDPDPPSISAEEEEQLDRINRGETDAELQARKDRADALVADFDWLIANGKMPYFPSHNEILRPATEVKASADTQRPNACEPPQDL